MKGILKRTRDDRAVCTGSSVFTIRGNYEL